MTPKSSNVADQVRELSLQPGDMIEGWQGAHSARLVLKFLGTEAVVFDEWGRANDGTWHYLGESAEWDLSCRDWVRVDEVQPSPCSKPWTAEEIANTDSMLLYLASVPPPPEGTDEWAAEKAAATDAQIDTLLTHPDWIARLRDLLADLPATVPAIPTTCRCGGCTDSRCPRRQGDPA